MTILDLDLILKGVQNPSKIPIYLKNNLPISKEIQQIGYRGIPFGVSKMYHRRVDPVSRPVSVWERDWDVLVVLDACRGDMMEEVVSEYSFLHSMETVWSVGGHSMEWLENTFKPAPSGLIKETAYITGNYYSGVISDLPFSVFNNLQDVNFEGDFPAPPAHVVTDSAISTARESEFDRLIIHYMQPHKPFLFRDDGRYDIKMKEWSIGWDLYRNYINGRISMDKLKTGFVDNLRYVLNEVALLLENIDASKVVITSDHGNAFGESFLWDHEIGVQHSSMRQVPWVETTATDEGTLSPKKYTTSSTDDDELQERLEKLGYLS